MCPLFFPLFPTHSHGLKITTKHEKNIQAFFLWDKAGQKWMNVNSGDRKRECEHARGERPGLGIFQNAEGFNEETLTAITDMVVKTLTREGGQRNIMYCLPCRSHNQSHLTADNPQCPLLAPPKRINFIQNA